MIRDESMSREKEHEGGAQYTPYWLGVMRHSPSLGICTWRERDEGELILHV